MTQQPGEPPAGYPPRLTGMRGSHAGSFEVAHQLRDRRSVDLAGVSRTGESVGWEITERRRHNMVEEAAVQIAKRAGRWIERAR